MEALPEKAARQLEGRKRGTWVCWSIENIKLPQRRKKLGGRITVALKKNLWFF